MVMQCQLEQEEGSIQPYCAQKITVWMCTGIDKSMGPEYLYICPLFVDIMSVWGKIRCKADRRKHLISNCQVQHIRACIMTNHIKVEFCPYYVCWICSRTYDLHQNCAWTILGILHLHLSSLWKSFKFTGKTPKTVNSLKYDSKILNHRTWSIDGHFPLLEQVVIRPPMITLELGSFSMDFKVTEEPWGKLELTKICSDEPFTFKVWTSKNGACRRDDNTATRTYDIFRRRLLLSHATKHIFRCRRIILPPAELVGWQYKTTTF